MKRILEIAWDNVKQQSLSFLANGCGMEDHSELMVLGLPFFDVYQKSILEIDRKNAGR